MSENDTMQIETPPVNKPYEKPEGDRRGLIIDAGIPAQRGIEGGARFDHS